jgi:hypothetical protein
MRDAGYLDEIAAALVLLAQRHMGPMQVVPPVPRPVPPVDAAVAHPVGSANVAASPTAAMATLRVLLVPFAFMLVPFR